MLASPVTPPGETISLPHVRPCGEGTGLLFVHVFIVVYHVTSLSYPLTSHRPLSCSHEGRVVLRHPSEQARRGEGCYWKPFRQSRAYRDRAPASAFHCGSPGGRAGHREPSSATPQPKARFTSEHKDWAHEVQVQLGEAAGKRLTLRKPHGVLAGPVPQMSHAAEPPGRAPGLASAWLLQENG